MHVRDVVGGAVVGLYAFRLTYEVGSYVYKNRQINVEIVRVKDAIERKAEEVASNSWTNCSLRLNLLVTWTFQTVVYLVTGDRCWKEGFISLAMKQGALETEKNQLWDDFAKDALEQVVGTLAAALFYRIVI